MRLISDIPLKKGYEMKKYRVLKDCYFGLAGELFINSVHPEEFMKSLVKEGWLSEVEEEKELWEKLIDYKDDHYVADTYWMNKAKIARQHFAEVARKARDSYNSYKIGEAGKVCSDFIIQAIESDGEK